MAADHVRGLLACRPHGPYLLGGFCVSALVALEMAQQLAQRGERVELVAMIDPPPPGALRWLRRWIEARARFSARIRRELLGEFFHAYKNVYRCRELSAQSLEQNMAVARNWLRGTPTSVFPQTSAAPNEAAMYLWMTAGYQPRRYVHPTAIIACDALMSSAASRIRRWRAFLPDLRTRVAPCGHLELVTTHSAETAAFLRACLHADRSAVLDRECTSQTFVPAAPQVAAMS